MVDCVEHLDLVDAATGPRQTRVRVCLELDAALRLAGGRLRLGRAGPRCTRAGGGRVRPRGRGPSGLRTGRDHGVRGPGRRPRRQPAGSLLKRAVVRAMQRSSVEELRHRREAAVAAVRAVTPLRFVDGGGTGSLETTTREDAVTELAAGSRPACGPGLFDFYRSFRPVPAAYFVLPVVRRPSPKIATLLGGGWIASGPPGKDRLPTLGLASRPARHRHRSGGRGADPAARQARAGPAHRRPGVAAARQGR